MLEEDEVIPYFFLYIPNQRYPDINAELEEL
jgi:hypothetical protein